MTTAEAVKELQENFGINAIYAQNVYSRISRNSNLHEEAAKIIENKPKPFVKWVGGKRQLLKQFKELGLYPPEHFNPTKNRYFEPFVGGGAVFFDLLPQKAFLSDMNFELVTTYNVIRDNVESLVKSLKKHSHDKEYFLKIREKNIANLSPLQIASRFIYLNRTCFNGMYRVNSSGGFNVPFGKYENPMICDEANLRKVSQSLQDISISHQDYSQAVKKAKKGDFIYFDPPYHPLSDTSSFTSYTKEDFNTQNQIALRDCFLELHNRGCFVMLSNSSAQFIIDIYTELVSYGIKIHKVEANRAINSDATRRGKIKEVLITNY